MPRYIVTWSAALTMKSEIEAPSEREAVAMAFGNDLPLSKAEIHECQPIFAEVETDFAEVETD